MILGDGKTLSTYDFSDFNFLFFLFSSYLCICFDWQTVQATFRLEEASVKQDKATDAERDKRIAASRTLKVTEADLMKARKELKEATRARASTELGLAGTQKQAQDQTKRLIEVEEQLKLANELIVDLKK